MALAKVIDISSPRRRDIRLIEKLQKVIDSALALKNFGLPLNDGLTEIQIKELRRRYAQWNIVPCFDEGRGHWLKFSLKGWRSGSASKTS